MDGETEWVRIDPAGLAEGRVCTVVAGGRALCLTRTAAGYGPLDNRCPHEGGPLGDWAERITSLEAAASLPAWTCRRTGGGP